MLFEGMEIPCLYIIAVMKINHQRKIPKSCITQQWLKTNNAYIESSCNELIDTETKNEHYGVLMAECSEMSYFRSKPNRDRLSSVE